MAAASEDNTLGPPDSGHFFDWPAIQERADSKLEVRYFIGDSRYVALLLDFSDFWFNGRYQYYKFDGNLLDRNELVTLCGPDEAEKLRREPGRKLKAFFPEQGGWVPLRCLREVQAKQQAAQQQEAAYEQDATAQLQQAPAATLQQAEKGKGKASAEELAADDRMNAYSGCRELTVPKEWAREEFRNCDFPLSVKLQVRLNGTLLPEQYDVKVSRDNRQDRASRRYRIALTSTLRELGELVQASKYIAEWRRLSEELIVISVNNAAISLPLLRPLLPAAAEEVKEEGAAWDDEAMAIMLAAEDTRAQPSTRARTLHKAATGGSRHAAYGCTSPTEVDEPVPGLREMLHAMWTEQRTLLEQQLEEGSLLEEKQRKLVAEHAGKLAALQQEHHNQITKLQSKQQADVLKAVQRQYADSSNQRNGHLIDQYRCELQLMNEKHGAQLGKLASKQEAELQALLEKQQQELRKLEDRISRLSAEQQEGLQSALVRHQDAICGRVERHQVAMQDDWQRCLHLEEEEAAVTLAALAATARSAPAAAAPPAAEPASASARLPAAAAAPAPAAAAAGPAPAAPAAASQAAAPRAQPAPGSTQQPAAASTAGDAAADCPAMPHSVVPPAPKPAALSAAEPPATCAAHEPQPQPAAPLEPGVQAPAGSSLQPAADLLQPAQHSSHQHPPLTAQPLPAPGAEATTSGQAVSADASQHSGHPAYLAGGHGSDLERRASSPACAAAVDKACAGAAALAPAGRTAQGEGASAQPGVEGAEPSCDAGTSSAQKRAWSAAAGVDSLSPGSLQPPIKRPHKLMVKMVHA